MGRITPLFLVSLALFSCGGGTRQPQPAPGTTAASAAPTPTVPCPTISSESSEQANVVLQGPPPIPDELRVRLGRYLNTRSARLASVADDGRSILVTTRFGETSQLHVVETPGGARTQLTFFDEPIRRAAFTPGNPDSVVYLTDVGGNEQYQLFRMNRSSGDITLLTDGKSRHPSFKLSRTGNRVAYSGNGRNGKDMDIYVGDARSASAGRLLLEREGHWFPMDWSRDGKRMLLGEYVSINDSRLHVVDLDSRKVERVSPKEPVAAHPEAVFDRGGKGFYVTTDREGEFVELYEVQPSKKAWRPLSRKIPWNVEEIALSHDGRTLAFTINEDGYNALYTLDTGTRRVQRRKGVPRGVIAGVKFARRANVLGFTVAGASRTGDAYTLNLTTGKLERWTKSEVGGLSERAFAEPSLVRYDTFDKRKIPAFYYRPKGKGPFPVLIDIHGGPEGQARPRFQPIVQYLVQESGIAVLSPNVRGSNGYGKSYLLLDNGMKREDSVKDVGALLDWIASNPDLDAKRVGVVGGSYGGYMVLASLIHYGNRIAAACDIVGISNFVTFLQNTKPYRRDLRRAEYGDERVPAMRDHLLSISPTTHASRIRTPLFLAHGANDPRVPAAEMDQIAKAVKANGQEVWTMLARNEGHGFRKKENRDLFRLLLVMFFEKHLKSPSGPREHR